MYRVAQLNREGYNHAITIARTKIDDTAFEVTWAEGRAMTLEQAIAYALEETV